ncbi:bifunctional 4-hydroxy-2-oxoglutarate aldolase/2-dehydro-3-deoxy-phosphogluconate aldolase [Marilutibacter aestuarii]|uniref:2-dehydro-3-deoxy-phosphogluconate aldolase n=1 Tax=Marilutibacter aestuarii TaxID=1706195 RepID=A0A508AUU2_9GAMM|nr:bifunctional 4-hydroxy-2-oxoglutarate aldolase/2-dehydro-3-deoxy-phosphogluconate aldolase [Lysobacter aestuarii]TQD50845.1 bifunctional 4-hydroxy-2-oxoglutarate aldolase/2-dehydro-3-deoxy-phosphogluconate aldolase [Lysobacter aestuarii]
MSGAEPPTAPDAWSRLLGGDRVVPVYTPSSVAEALEVGAALKRGGLHSVEVTLRTPVAIEAVRALAESCPGLAVGAGTVLDAGQLEQVQRAGAAFAVSPGGTAALMRLAVDMGLPYLPGVVTASELMVGLGEGYRMFKMFPAEPINSLALLKAWAGPFADVGFCPTGGIDLGRAQAYLARSNVVCVGGSWLTPGDALAACDWDEVERRAAEAARMSAVGGV